MIHQMTEFFWFISSVKMAKKAKYLILPESLSSKVSLRTKMGFDEWEERPKVSL